MVVMTEVKVRVGNVTRQRYEQLVAQAKDLIAQVSRAQFALGDMALETEPMRPVGGSMPHGTEDLFTVAESLQICADDIGGSGTLALFTRADSTCAGVWAALEALQKSNSS
ncbi:hypothetical protein ADL30_20405 [Streptomyces sp. NRRL S-1521]|nr:hypothetical protein ADL30_20405 [Streptomyces sp. NRRL S-1521]